MIRLSLFPRRRRMLHTLLLLYFAAPLLSGLARQQGAPAPAPAAPVYQIPDTLSDWEALQMAIAFTESRFNPDAVGKTNDLGIYQITPIYVAEINRITQSNDFQHEDATDIAKAIMMFNTMQDIKNPRHDINTAIRLHNKSPYYKKRVLENYTMIKRYEAMRLALLEYEKEKQKNTKTAQR